MREARFGRGLRRLAFILTALLPASGVARAQTTPATYLEQGPNWSNMARAKYYGQDQGSEMIPLSWLNALKAPDGQPFLWDKLARYGYITNEFSTGNLPIGFTISTFSGQPTVGMTCSACHTRNIVANGQTYRVDGGPAFVDFQALLTDMVNAVGALTTDDAQFQAFATAVLGPNPTPDAFNDLKARVTVWYARENAMKNGAYPTADIWGLGRLDAVSMIFDRLTGLDLAVAPAYSIPANILPADAPTRYPFVWNAPTQNKTQWPGFAPNGSEFFGLIRNTGEVFGVFASMHPTIGKGLFGSKVASWNTSANWPGLVQAEENVMKIGAPQWAWPESVDLTAARVGQGIYKAKCGSCHSQVAAPAAFPYTDGPTWKTPLNDVNSDSRENSIIGLSRQSGALNGATTFPAAIFKPIGPNEKAITLLSAAVTGAIFESGQWYATLSGKKINKAAIAANLLMGLLPRPNTGTNPYESRVLYGIWAAAPYLHNGSVPTLEDLLLPATQRPESFALGPNYDLTKVGLAAVQPGGYVRHTTADCNKKGGDNSGNSRCGHEFGTTLSPDQKRALIEYMKMLGSPGWTN